MKSGRVEPDWFAKAMAKDVYSKVNKTEVDPWLKGKFKFRLILLRQQEAERYRRWLARLAPISGEH